MVCIESYVCSTIDYLLPLFLQLLKDDFPEVRLNIISRLDQVNNGEWFACLQQKLVIVS